MAKIVNTGAIYCRYKDFVTQHGFPDAILPIPFDTDRLLNKMCRILTRGRHLEQKWTIIYIVEVDISDITSISFDTIRLTIEQRGLKFFQK